MVQLVHLKVLNYVQNHFLGIYIVRNQRKNEVHKVVNILKIRPRTIKILLITINRFSRESTNNYLSYLRFMIHLWLLLLLEILGLAKAIVTKEVIRRVEGNRWGSKLRVVIVVALLH